MELFDSISIVALIAIVLTVLWFAARPATLRDGARGYYVVNAVTNIPCNEGRVYLTQKGAQKALDKLRASWAITLGGKTIFEIRKTL